MINPSSSIDSIANVPTLYQHNSNAAGYNATVSGITSIAAGSSSNHVTIGYREDRSTETAIGFGPAEIKTTKDGSLFIGGVKVLNNKESKILSHEEYDNVLIRRKRTLCGVCQEERWCLLLDEDLPGYVVCSQCIFDPLLERRAKLNASEWCKSEKDKQ